MYCGALAFFALIAFYPFSSLLLWVSRYALPWGPADGVVLETLREYYPEGQTFLLRNLEVSVEQYGRAMRGRSIFWILLGAAGFFIPLETAFNQVWGAKAHRSYWSNQAVGFLLTSACCGLGVLFVLATAGLHAVIASVVPGEFLARAVRYVVLRLVALCFSVMVIFLFYRFLPNCRVRSRDVALAAVVAGIAAEAVRSVYLLALPLLDLQKSQGPYYISISFVLLVYFESFVLLGGAFLAARPDATAEVVPGPDALERVADPEEAEPVERPVTPMPHRG